MRNDFAALNGMFKFAVYPKQYLQTNLMDYVEKRKEERSYDLFDPITEKKMTVTAEEAKQVIAYLRSIDPDHFFILPVQIAFFTGLRRGELAGLTWEDIDFERQRIAVRRTMIRDVTLKEWELKVTKGKRIRYVEFGNTLRDILLEEKSKQEENEREYGLYYQHHYCQDQMVRNHHHFQIFSSIHTETGTIGSRIAHGRPVEDMDRSQPFHPLSFVCRKADGELVTIDSLHNISQEVSRKFPDMQFGLHKLRHNYASTLVENGANYKDVQELLGHADLKTTMDIYVHTSESSKRRAVDIYENAVGK